MRLVIVSGLSGSGKSVALRTLEDLGYYSIDNLPVFLLKELALGLTGSSDTTYTLTAVGIDARNTEQHLRDLPDLIRHARAHGIDCSVLFLEAEAETLIKRFSETRRKHPLTLADRPLAEAIELERRLLDPIRGEASVIIDTTRTNVHELRDLVRERIAGNDETSVYQSVGLPYIPPELREDRGEFERDVPRLISFSGKYCPVGVTMLRLVPRIVFLGAPASSAGVEAGAPSSSHENLRRMSLKPERVVLCGTPYTVPVASPQA